MNAAEMFRWNVLSEQFGIKRCQFLDNLPFHFFFFKIFLKFTFCRIFFFIFNCNRKPFAWEILWSCFQISCEKKINWHFSTSLQEGRGGRSRASHSAAESRTRRGEGKSKQAQRWGCWLVPVLVAVQLDCFLQVMERSDFHTAWSHRRMVARWWKPGCNQWLQPMELGWALLMCGCKHCSEDVQTYQWCF